MDKPFPMFNIRESKEGMLRTRPTSVIGKEVIASQTDLDSGYESQPKNSNFQHLVKKPVKFHNFFEKSTLAASRSSKDDFTGSTSKTPLLFLKNESSVDSDTMEMNALHENRLSGTTSSQSNKVTLALAREDAEQRLLDINQKLPELQAVASSTDDRDTSSSRTQSLGVERLFSNPEQAEDSRSNAGPDGPSGLDPSSRWIKRLKFSAFHSLGHGTKNSNLPEVSSHEKANKLSIPTSLEASKPNQIELPLAHSWIRRWSHNQAMTTQKNHEPDVICEPESFNETSDKFQKKLFPSFAAMAMMGKAVKRFRPCEFQKLGPSVVWNIEQF